MNLQGKSVLVTGAGGSIGSEICEQVIAAGALGLTLVSLTESGLYKILRRLRSLESYCGIIGVLGSAGDRELMRQHMEGIDVVIHAGAHKHVPLCQDNVCVAVENNAIASLRLAEVAMEFCVKTFVQISTDKAVRPESIMGATKRLAELLINDLSYGDESGLACSKRPEESQNELLRCGTDTTFIIVRFGNVLNSDGSVFPLWRDQIAAGGPLTLTDPNCERYFMSIPEAVSLVLGAIELNTRGTFVFDMGAPQKLGDIAERMIAESGQQVPIQITGLRPGEKLTEEIYHDARIFPTSNPKILRAVKFEPEPDYRAYDQLCEAVDMRDEKMTRELLWKLVNG